MGRDRRGVRGRRDLVCNKAVTQSPITPRAGTIQASANWLSDSSQTQTQEQAMIRRFAVIAVAVAGICGAMPASAEEFGVGVGPGGVTVGTVRGDRDRDRDRDREVIRERDHRDRDTVVIQKGRDHDRDYDRDHRTVIIDRDRS